MSEIVILEDRRTCQASTAAAAMHYQAIFNSLSADNPICEVPDRTRHNGSGGRVLRHEVQIANQPPVHTVGFLFPSLGSSSSSFFPSPLFCSPLLVSFQGLSHAVVTLRRVSLHVFLIDSARRESN